MASLSQARAPVRVRDRRERTASRDQVSRETPRPRTGAQHRTPRRTTFGSRTVPRGGRGEPHTRRDGIAQRCGQERRRECGGCEPPDPLDPQRRPDRDHAAVALPTRRLRRYVERMCSGQACGPADDLQPPGPSLLQQRHVRLVRCDQLRQILGLGSSRPEVGPQVERHDPQRPSTLLKDRDSDRFLR
jgi:hypothetical protein